MLKRVVIVLTLLLALAVAIAGWDLFCIYRNLHEGKRVQESLLSLLQSRYPDRVFKPAGVGYNGPSAGIRVAGPIDAETRGAMRRLLEDEKANKNIRVWLILEFDGDVIGELVRF